MSNMSVHSTEFSIGQSEGFHTASAGSGSMPLICHTTATSLKSPSSSGRILSCRLVHSATRIASLQCRRA